MVSCGRGKLATLGAVNKHLCQNSIPMDLKCFIDSKDDFINPWNRPETDLVLSSFSRVGSNYDSGARYFVCTFYIDTIDSIDSTDSKVNSCSETEEATM